MNDAHIRQQPAVLIDDLERRAEFATVRMAWAPD